jgi:hypothetical protein
VPPGASVTGKAFRPFSVFISFDVRTTGESYLAESFASYIPGKLPVDKAQSVISDIRDCTTSSATLWTSVTGSNTPTWSSPLGEAVDAYTPCEDTMNTIFSEAGDQAALDTQTDELASLDAVKQIGASWSEKIVGFLAHNAPTLIDAR